MKRTIGLLLAAALAVGLMATAAIAAVPGDGVRDFAATAEQGG